MSTVFGYINPLPIILFLLTFCVVISVQRKFAGVYCMNTYICSTVCPFQQIALRTRQNTLIFQSRIVILWIWHALLANKCFCTLNRVVLKTRNVQDSERKRGHTQGPKICKLFCLCGFQPVVLSIWWCIWGYKSWNLKLCVSGKAL